MSVARAGASVHRLPDDIRPAAEATLPADIAFLAAGIDARVLAAATRRARVTGAEPAAILIASGIIGEADYYRQLAAALDLPFVEPDAVVGAVRPSAFALAAIDRIRLAEIGETAFGRLVALAPEGAGVGRLAELVAAHPQIKHSLRITTPSAIRSGLVAAFSTELTDRARTGLAARYPKLSARFVGGWQSAVAALAALTTIAAIWALFPLAVPVALNIALAVPFLAIVSLRLAAAIAPPTDRLSAPLAGDAGLPVYSLLVPLYREAGMVAGLITALRRLDYPPEKLDIKLIVEADDVETRAAIDALKLGPPFETAIVPASEPRTKPKALSFALPLARGRYVVVYDAEDRPAPDQLRRALAAFRRGGAGLGCVQARLVVDPPNGHFLARQFTAEYAGLFFTLLPFLARLRLPLPLGGTSNHFRRDVLRQIGGWDPNNVTEDADIGIRLARFGYRADVIASDTLEEPPARFTDWLKQRTRWFKGWMQTWSVHMRDPRRLYRDLGLRDFLAFQVIIGGPILSALIHPVFLVIVALTLIELAEILELSGVFGTALLGVNGFNLAAGYAGGIALAVTGLMRRRAGGLARQLVWLPVYWVLMSIAAYRAVWQFWRAPSLWEKTPHGGAIDDLPQ